MGRVKSEPQRPERSELGQRGSLSASLFDIGRPQPSRSERRERTAIRPASLPVGRERELGGRPIYSLQRDSRHCYSLQRYSLQRNGPEGGLLEAPLSRRSSQLRPRGVFPRVCPEMSGRASKSRRGLTACVDFVLTALLMLGFLVFAFL